MQAQKNRQVRGLGDLNAMEVVPHRDSAKNKTYKTNSVAILAQAISAQAIPSPHLQQFPFRLDLVAFFGHAGVRRLVLRFGDDERLTMLKVMERVYDDVERMMQECNEINPQPGLAYGVAKDVDGNIDGDDTECVGEGAGRLHEDLDGDDAECVGVSEGRLHLSGEDLDQFTSAGLLANSSR